MSKKKAPQLRGFFTTVACAGLTIENDQFNTTVQLATFIGVIGCHRLGFAITTSRQATCGNTLADQVVTHGVGTTL
jgi:hypothetical protein